MTSVEVAATELTQVTVYRNGALVQRRGRGRGALEVRGLPLLYSSDTLRVRPGAGGVRDLEETVTLHATPAPAPPNEADALALALELALVEDEIRACDVIAQAADRLMPELADPRAPAALPDPARWTELLALADAQRADAVERKALAERRKREIKRAQRKLASTETGDREPPRVLRGARFTLTSDAATDFEIEYFVHAARWVPTYALHLDQGKARLVVAALVAQATGEDWSGVPVGVSTSDLLRESTLPTLTSWRIGRAQPPVARGFRPLPSDLPSLFWGYDKQPRRAQPAPTKPAPPKGSAGPAGFEKLPTDEVRSFEKERTGALARAAVDLDDDTGSDLALEEDEMDEGAAAPREQAEAPENKTRAGAWRSPGPVPVAAAMPMAPPPPAAAPSSRIAFAADLAAASVGGGGAPGGMKRRAREEQAVVRAQQELPPRWRTAYLRMAGADDPQRGRLVPLDPTERLAWLLESNDVEGAGSAELRRAIDALLIAHNRLQQAPLPRGTSALLGTHYPSVMRGAAATDVPGDGAFYRVEVRAEDGAASFEHRAVPRASNDVWRTCRVDIKGPPLPAGPLAVYEDGVFRVNARLDGSGGGKPLDVNLGVDPDVRVVTRTAHVNQAEKGLVSQTSRVEHKIHLELRSTRDKPATVVLFDRLPVPADNVKDVNVQVLDEKPPAKRTNRDAFGNEVVGAIEWRVTVMPGDTMHVDYRYAIDLPAKTELEGGNRRE